METLFMIAYRNRAGKFVCELHNSYRNVDDFMWFSRAVIANNARDVFRMQGMNYEVWMVWDARFSRTTIEKKMAIEIANKMIESLEEKPDTIVSTSEYYATRL